MSEEMLQSLLDQIGGKPKAERVDHPRLLVPTTETSVYKFFVWDEDKLFWDPVEYVPARAAGCRDSTKTLDHIEKRLKFLSLSEKGPVAVAIFCDYDWHRFWAP